MPKDPIIDNPNYWPLPDTTHSSKDPYGDTIFNNPLLSLTNRTAWLKAHISGTIVDWATVSAALGGHATGADQIFKSDGAGGGTMGKNLQVIANRLTVAAAGDADYATIHEAITYALTQSPTPGNPWEIRVYPGAYSEPAMSIVPGLSVVSDSPIGAATVLVVAQDSAADLFTCTGGSVRGITASGVTDALKCLFRMAAAGSILTMVGCSFKNCSSGLIVSNGAAALVDSSTMVISGAGQKVGTCFKVTGVGSYLEMRGMFVMVPLGVLALYPGENPIEEVFKVELGAVGEISSSIFYVPDNLGTSCVVCASTGARVDVFATSITFSNCAFHIDSLGSDSRIIGQGGIFRSNVLNVLIESSTGKVFKNWSTDVRSNSVVTGGEISGLIQYRDDDSQRILGAAKYTYPSLKDVELADYFADYVSTGRCEGGDVTCPGGLFVDIAAGDGWIRRPLPENDSFWVEWDATVAPLALAASSTNYVYYDSVTDSLTVSVASPSRDTCVLFAIAVTNGSAIRYLHRVRVQVEDEIGRMQDYLVATRKFAWNSGLNVVAGTNPLLNLSVNSGSYYRALDLIPCAGAGPVASWSYYYGAGGATEVAGVTALNTTQYDLAGTLTGMTPTFYRSDTVYITSDNRISIIYGTDEYTTSLLAQGAPIGTAPNFISETACILAQVIVKQGSGIDIIVDRRPQPGATTGPGSAGGVTVHGLLSGLGVDDHAIYMLVGGGRAMTGNLQLGGHDITGVGLVDGVDVSAHAARHDPGAIDALSLGTPVAVLVGAVADAGSDADYVHSDHQHGVAAGVDPQSIGTANVEGGSSSVARADHAHDHGSQSTGSHHAVVIAAGANGFMSGADKTKLDGVAAGATNLALATLAPHDVTKAAADKGVGTTAARDDHKHDISTATAVALSVGGSSAEGSGTALARAAHTHACAVGTPVNVGTANAAGASGNFCDSSHVHDHGNQSTGSHHAVVIAAGANGFMSGADKTKLDAAVSTMLLFGNTDVASNTTTRYLSPGFENVTATTTAIPFRLPFAATLRRLYVRQNTATGNANAIVYTMRVNGTPSTLTCSVAANVNDGSDLAHSVVVAQGDLIDIVVTKASSVGTSPGNITATIMAQQ